MFSIESTYRVRQEQMRDSLQKYGRRQLIQAATAESAKPKLLPIVAGWISSRLAVWKAMRPGKDPAPRPNVIRR